MSTKGQSHLIYHVCMGLSYAVFFLKTSNLNIAVNLTHIYNVLYITYPKVASGTLVRSILCSIRCRKHHANTSVRSLISPPDNSLVLAIDNHNRPQ